MTLSEQTQTRALVQAFAQNDQSKLSSVDWRELLDRLGIPQLRAVTLSYQRRHAVN